MSNYLQQIYQNNLNQLSQRTNEIYNAPFEFHALITVDLISTANTVNLYLALTTKQAVLFEKQIKQLNPNIKTILFHTREGSIFDRIDDSPTIQAKRIIALARILNNKHKKISQPILIIACVDAIFDYYPPVARIKSSLLSLKKGLIYSRKRLISWLNDNGYFRDHVTSCVGDYSVRGGIIDVFSTRMTYPLRIDFFDDQIEMIKFFDPQTQRTIKEKEKVILTAVNEIAIDDEIVKSFRTNFLQKFGTLDNKHIYQAISNKQRFSGHTHFIKLFYNSFVNLIEFCQPALILSAVDLVSYSNNFFDDLNSQNDFFNKKADKYNQREVKKLSINDIVFPQDTILKTIEKSTVLNFKQFDTIASGLEKNKEISSEQKLKNTHSYNNQQELYERTGCDSCIQYGESFITQHTNKENIFKKVADYILLHSDKYVFLCSQSESSLQRLCQFVQPSLPQEITPVDSLEEIKEAKVYALKFELPKSLITSQAIFISDVDLIGKQRIKKRRKKSNKQEIINAAQLKVNDLIVHIDHGIGLFKGFETINVNGADHDCLLLLYADNDRVYLPVENIDIISRHGSEYHPSLLDKLGSSNWQVRKTRLKEKLFKIASELLEIAAKRRQAKARSFKVNEIAMQEFCKAFLFEETDDQQDAIDDVISDLQKNFPMDRLICGDVGFGKTEVALRAAFSVANNGGQVAILCPTTLLCHQHFNVFKERFSHFPINVSQLSRLVNLSQRSKTKKQLASGEVDIIIGTHALLSNDVCFKSLALLIVDEEQRFGVKHKEKLKTIRSDTHVLSMSATPIPRTLNMSLSGIRDLSLIATPPMERLPIKTTIAPENTQLICEVLLREHFRGGQSYYIAPRLSDLAPIATMLKKYVPELSIRIGHGQLPPTVLEKLMIDFYKGEFDVLLSTSIVESGLDVPRANTMIIHRADKFGLAQLHQFRGRVGRAKLQGYAFLTFPKHGVISSMAMKRLRVLQSLEELGSGFKIASQDMELRGVGNLIGKEQSGHVKEVGVELYQHMLEEAVVEIKQGTIIDESWSPEIAIGLAIKIPHEYIEDANMRLNLYRRLASASGENDINDFAYELKDRFGTYPQQIENLIQVMHIKNLCKIAYVNKIEAGPYGIIIQLREKNQLDFDSLLSSVLKDQNIKLRPDNKLVFKQKLSNKKAVIAQCKNILFELGKFCKAS